VELKNYKELKQVPTRALIRQLNELLAHGHYNKPPGLILDELARREMASLTTTIKKLTIANTTLVGITAVFALAQLLRG